MSNVYGIKASPADVSLEGLTPANHQRTDILMKRDMLCRRLDPAVLADYSQFHDPAFLSFGLRQFTAATGASLVWAEVGPPGTADIAPSSEAVLGWYSVGRSTEKLKFIPT